MSPWIQIFSNVSRHRKTYKLGELLGLGNKNCSANCVAVGLLVNLWSWAIQNAYDGDLSECSNATIAEACGWKGNADTLVTALKSAGFLELDGKIHDWDDYTVSYVSEVEERKKKNRERMAQKRNCARTVRAQDECTVCESAHLHNITVHNSTVHNSNSLNNNDNNNSCAEAEAMEIVGRCFTADDGGNELEAITRLIPGWLRLYPKDFIEEALCRAQRYGHLTKAYIETMLTRWSEAGTIISREED